MTFTFYEMTDDERTINKSFTVKGTANGNIIDGDYMSGHIRIILASKQDGYLKDMRYMSMIVGTDTYYYFIRKCDSLANGTYQLEYELDVLETFKDIILETEVCAVRSSNQYNLYLHDDSFYTSVAYPQMSTISFPSGFGTGYSVLVNVFTG